MIGYLGPKDQWEYELEKVSRSGLLDALVNILSRFDFDREQAMRVAKSARREGKYLDMMARHDRYQQNPDKAFGEYIRRQASAKKAARRRKRETKKESKRNA